MSRQYQRRIDEVLKHVHPSIGPIVQALFGTRASIITSFGRPFTVPKNPNGIVVRICDDGPRSGGPSRHHRPSLEAAIKGCIAGAVVILPERDFIIYGAVADAALRAEGNVSLIETTAEHLDEWKRVLNDFKPGLGTV